MMKQHGKDENRTQRKTQFLRCHAIQTFSLDARQNWYYPPFKLKKINFVDLQYQPTILDGLKWKSNLDIPKIKNETVGQHVPPPLIYVGGSLTRAVVTKYSERQQTIS